MPETKTENTQQSTQTQNYAGFQLPYLTDAMSKASGIYSQGAGNLYGGDVLAGFRPEQVANFRNILGYAGGNTVPGQTAAAGGALTGAGIGGLTGALGGLGSFTPQGGTESNIAAARAYADNPAVGGMVDAAMRDARRGVYEDTLPQITRASALTGNTNSSTRGIREGIVERGLAEKTADVSAGIRGDLFNRGLQLAEGGRQFDNTATLDALSKRGTLGGSAAAMGLGSLGDSITQQLGLYGAAGTAGEGLRAGDQAALDAMRGKSEYGTDRLSQMLAQYYGIVGSNSWGSNSTGTKTTETETQASPWTIAGGLAGAAGGFFGGNGMFGANGAFPNAFRK